MATKGQIFAVLLREDEVGMHAVGRALVHLYNRQTRDEQIAETTSHYNNIGFTPADGKKGVSMAKFYMDRGFLTPKQVAYWRGRNKRGISRICKYHRQLIEEADKKQAMKRHPARGVRHVHG